MKSFVIGLLAVASLASAGLHAAPGQYDWEEYAKRLQASEKVSPLGPNLMGEQVQLANGALSFSATDVSLPGNDGLAVAFGRAYSVFNRLDYGDLGPLADWTLDVPSISAVLLGDWTNGTAKTTDRCTAIPAPVLLNGFQRPDFWQGVTLDMPGGGELLRSSSTIQKPTDGATYHWVTSSQVHVSCLTTIKNGAGQGFLAVTPDGTKYWFDWMAQTAETPLKRLVATDPTTPPHWVTATRKKTSLYLTRVQDRFGNYVNYTYTNLWNQPVKLTGISANDGRQLTISYSGSQISAVSDGTRTWSYAYATTTSGRKTLTQVTLPDASKWTINFHAFTNAVIESDDGVTEPSRSCLITGTPLNPTLTPVGTITHPSGATGTFTVDLKEHGRSNVPVSCSGVTTSPAGSAPGTGNNPADDVNFVAISAYSFTLKQKRLAGPGLPTADWNYSYANGVSVYMYPGTTIKYPVCDWTKYDCNEPVCESATCAGSSQTTVTGPGGTWVRYKHGNSYHYNEGKLLSVETGTSLSNILRTDTYEYDLSKVDQTNSYPALYGGSTRLGGDGFQAEYHRPQTKATTAQQSATFTRQVTAFDKYVNPLSVIRSSSATTSPQSITDTIVYENNVSKWVIGQVRSVNNNGQFPVQITYDPVTAQQLTYTSFGKLLQTLGYNPDGTVRTIKDGNNNITTLDSWYRGVPRTIYHPDFQTQSAVVNALGQITSVTDQNGYSTGYAYDLMGRLKTITPPTGDTVAWSPTSIVFAPVAAIEYGIAAGHWRRTETRGNYNRVTYFDAMWRPVIEREWDTANVTGTQRFNGWKYDIDGRTTFEGYPRTSASSIASFTTGVSSVYDVLGRPTLQSQTSELGNLSTTYAYLSGLQTRVTNPRGQSTTTTFQAFDTPDTSLPLTITAPETQTTTIARDVWGKPTSITRSGTYGATAVSSVRRYVYDTQQQLCKRIDPEAGATFFDYDGVGNLSWSADGSSLTSTNCDRTSVAFADKTRRGYDAMNRLLWVAYPTGTNGISYSYEPDGALATINTDDGINWSYTYNRRRLLTSEQSSLEDMTFTYGYDTLGHLSSVTYPNSMFIAHAPNALGQPTRAGSFATGAQYFPNGALKQFSYGNAIIRVNTQNARGLTSRSRDTYSTTVFHDFQYAFDGNANVTTITDLGQAGLQTKSMTYDGLDRLITANATGLWGTGRYAYDPLDNIREADLGSRQYRYQYYSNGRLATIRTPAAVQVKSYLYDVRGNVISDGTVRPTFDRANRITSIRDLATYYYDGHGRRMAEIRPNGAKYSLYTRDGLLRGGPNNMLGGANWHVFLGSQMVATNFAPSNGSTAVTTYHHADALGSPVVDTTSTRGVKNRTNYAPYGEALNRTVDEPGYTGHLMDGNTGLIYMQQRYYDPVVGRFLSVDPVATSGQNGSNFNRYWYGNNNPYKYRDPDGRLVCGVVTECQDKFGSRRNPFWPDVQLSHRDKAKTSNSHERLRSRVMSEVSNDAAAVPKISSGDLSTLVAFTVMKAQSAPKHLFTSAEYAVQFKTFDTFIYSEGLASIKFDVAGFGEVYGGDINYIGVGALSAAYGDSKILTVIKVKAWNFKQLLMGEGAHNWDQAETAVPWAEYGFDQYRAAMGQ